MLQLFEFVLFVMFSYGVLSQVIVPLWNGVPFFPWVRKPGTVQSRMAKVREEQEVASIEQEIERAIAEARKHGCEVSHDLSEIRCGHANHSNKGNN